MRDFFKKRGIPDLLNAIALLFGIVALICYLVSAEDKSSMTDTHISVLVYLPIALGIVVNCVAVFFQNSLLKMFAFFLYLLSAAMWGFTQAGYIVNVMMGIDGNTYSFAYILSIIAMLVAMLLSLLAIFRFGKKKAAAEQTTDNNLPQ